MLNLQSIHRYMSPEANTAFAAAAAGTKQPTVHELLLGSPFLSGSITTDIKAFAETLLHESVDHRAYRLRECAEGLKSQPTARLLAVARGLLEPYGGYSGILAGPQHRLRCTLYLAALGDTAACEAISAETMRQAASAPGGHRIVFMCRAFGWTSLAPQLRAETVRAYTDHEGLDALAALHAVDLDRHVERALVGLHTSDGGS